MENFSQTESDILSKIKKISDRNSYDVIKTEIFGKKGIITELFKKIGKTRNFIILARTLKFRKIHNSYGGSIDFSLPKEKREEDGKKVALFNSAGHLELAVYKSNPLTVGSASSLFGLNYRDPVTIEFD